MRNEIIRSILIELLAHIPRLRMYKSMCDNKVSFPVLARAEYDLIKAAFRLKRKQLQYLQANLK